VFVTRQDYDGPTLREALWPSLLILDLPEKKLAGDKHSSLFCAAVSDEDFFSNIDYMRDTFAVVMNTEVQ
jgi:hypothetical protein